MKNQILWALILTGPINLPTDSLILVHTSKHYHTDASTIKTTEEIVKAAAFRKWEVIALAQEDIRTDPLWYSFRGLPITSTYYSHHGESLLVPKTSNGNFRVTLVGGYHNACLGWALAEILSRALQDQGVRVVEVMIPTKAIFTGFRIIDGKLTPASPEAELAADDSIDGLSLYGVTQGMNTQSWRAFIRESIKVAVFQKAPMMGINLESVWFEIRRDNVLVDKFKIGIGSQKTRIVRFNYVN